MNSKKIFLSIVLLCLLSIIFVPFLAKAAGNPTEGQPLVPCNGSDCTICSFFQMLTTIYNFIVWDLATPLAVIALIVGGIFILISAGNPNLMGTGKTILYAAIIGLALVFGSYLIIDFILHAIGYTQSWSSLNISCS
jgi:hypothetical protein